MPGRFYTYITIEDVTHKETGRKAALRKFVFLHDLLWINLGNGKSLRIDLGSLMRNIIFLMTTLMNSLRR